MELMNIHRRKFAHNNTCTSSFTFAPPPPLFPLTKLFLCPWQTHNCTCRLEAWQCWSNAHVHVHVCRLVITGYSPSWELYQRMIVRKPLPSFSHLPVPFQSPHPIFTLLFPLFLLLLLLPLPPLLLLLLLPLHLFCLLLPPSSSSSTSSSSVCSSPPLFLLLLLLLLSLLLPSPPPPAYHHISKTIEVCRVQLFDIVTQYKAIFPDDDSTLLASFHGNRSGGRRQVLEGALFSGWLNNTVSSYTHVHDCLFTNHRLVCVCVCVHQQIWQFLQLLEADLSRGVAGRMDSLLNNCMYFGLSFSRVGADFRPLIMPVFLRVFLRSFRQALHDAQHQWVALPW